VLPSLTTVKAIHGSPLVSLGTLGYVIRDLVVVGQLLFHRHADADAVNKLALKFHLLTAKRDCVSWPVLGVVADTGA